MTSIWAVLKTGAAYVPIDPYYPQARIHFIEEDSSLESVVDRTGCVKFNSSIHNKQPHWPEMPVLFRRIRVP